MDYSPARLLCPWDSRGKNPAVGCHALLQGLFLTQEQNPSLLHWQADSLSPSHLGSPQNDWDCAKRRGPGPPLDCKEIQPVHSEGDQPWDFFGKNDAEAETPVLWLNVVLLTTLFIGY